MIAAALVIVLLAVAPTICAVLLAGKLVTMLFGRQPYWIRREGYIDKKAQPAVHAFYVGAFSLAFIVSLALSCLSLWAVLRS